MEYQVYVLLAFATAYYKAVLIINLRFIYHCRYWWTSEKYNTKIAMHEGSSKCSDYFTELIFAKLIKLTQFSALLAWYASGWFENTGIPYWFISSLELLFPDANAFQTAVYALIINAVSTTTQLNLISIYKLGDVGILSNLIGSLSLTNGQCPPPGTRKLHKLFFQFLFQVNCKCHYGTTSRY